MRANLLQDLNALSCAWTVDVFQKALLLFFQKWEANVDAKVKAVILHFKTEWCNKEKVNQWACCFCKNHVVNNNSLESTNNVIKQEVTQRQLLTILTFLKRCLLFLKSQSWKRNPDNPNHIKYAKQHTFITKDYTSAHSWNMNKRKQVRIVDGIYVALSPNSTGELTDARARRLIELFTTCSFPTFDIFSSYFFNVFILHEDTTRPEGFNCTCKTNAKTFTCDHSLGVANLRGLCKPPNPAASTLIGHKRKRGRRSAIGTAWEYQPVDIASPEEHQEQDPAVLRGDVVDGVNLAEDLDID